MLADVIAIDADRTTDIAALRQAGFVKRRFQFLKGTPTPLV
jgi:hypothetical protein